MAIQHKDLAAGKWALTPFVEQMAHIGGEVERALNWLAKNNISYTSQAFERALELIDFSMATDQSRPHVRELARVREMIADFFAGQNQFQSSDASLRKYFSCFAYAARKGR